MVNRGYSELIASIDSFEVYKSDFINLHNKKAKELEQIQLKKTEKKKQQLIDEDNKVWKNIKETNTLASYQSYLSIEKYTLFNSEAKKEILKIQEVEKLKSLSIKENFEKRYDFLFHKTKLPFLFKMQDIARYLAYIFVAIFFIDIFLHEVLNIRLMPYGYEILYLVIPVSLIFLINLFILIYYPYKNNRKIVLLPSILLFLYVIGIADYEELSPNIIAIPIAIFSIIYILWLFVEENIIEANILSLKNQVVSHVDLFPESKNIISTIFYTYNQKVNFSTLGFLEFIAISLTTLIGPILLILGIFYTLAVFIFIIFSYEWSWIKFILWWDSFQLMEIVLVLSLTLSSFIFIFIVLLQAKDTLLLKQFLSFESEDLKDVLNLES